MRIVGRVGVKVRSCKLPRSVCIDIHYLLEEILLPK